MLREEVGVGSGHRNRFMSRCLLNLLDRRSGHSQPRAEGVAVAVPGIAGDLCLIEARYKP
jgi:hypothetical protein